MRSPGRDSRVPEQFCPIDCARALVVSVGRQSPGAFLCHLPSILSSTFVFKVFETTFLSFSPKTPCRCRSCRRLGGCMIRPTPVSLGERWSLYGHQTPKCPSASCLGGSFCPSWEMEGAFKPWGAGTLGHSDLVVASGCREK